MALRSYGLNGGWGMGLVVKCTVKAPGVHREDDWRREGPPFLKKNPTAAQTTRLAEIYPMATLATRSIPLDGRRRHAEKKK